MSNTADSSEPKQDTPATTPGGFSFSDLRFADLPLHEKLHAALAHAGFEHCTHIQAASLEKALNGSDLFGKAQTGTGKTAAFLVCILQRILSNPMPDLPVGKPRGLVVAPTRELAMQIRKDAEQLSHGTQIRTILLVGGEDAEKQRRALKAGKCDLLVATPGRLLDMRRQGQVSLKGVEVLVLDEADRLLDMGFYPDLRTIVSHCPQKGQRQSLMFSATLPVSVMRLGERWLNKPEQISVDEKPAAENVRQRLYIARSQDRVPFLVRLLSEEGIKAVVFANRRSSVRQLQKNLQNKGVSCVMIAGDVSQPKRKQALERFQSGKFNVLIATDVAGRGLHLEGVTHVVNFELPENPEQYVHRIGRTGRIGASGTSISFATEEQAFLIPEIEEYMGESLECEPLPKLAQ